VQIALEKGTINTSSMIFPRRFRELLLPHIEVDFEDVAHIVEVINRTHCGDCSNHRHGKIINWLCSHFVKQELFRMPRLLSHIDEILYEYLTNQYKFNRKIRRYYPYLPRSSTQLLRHEKLTQSSIKKNAKQRTVSRNRARDSKYEAQIGINLKHTVGMGPDVQEAVNMLNDNIKTVVDSINNISNVPKMVSGNIITRLTSFITSLGCTIISIIRHPNIVDVILSLTNFFSRYIESIDITFEYLHRAMEQVAKWVRGR
jgi:hypothetical protein